MNLQIDIVLNAENEKSLVFQKTLYKTEALREKLVSGFGIKSTIHYKLPATCDNQKFYLFFTDYPVNFPENQQTRNLVHIGMTTDEILNSGYFRKYDFAALIDTRTYLTNSVFLYGKKNAINNHEFEYIHEYENGYAFLSSPNSQGIIELIIEYLAALKN